MEVREKEGKEGREKEGMEVREEKFAKFPLLGKNCDRI